MLIILLLFLLQGNLNMIAPDVEVEGKGIILISSEEGETEANNDKFLKDLGLVDGSILTCDDFLQSYTLKVRVNDVTFSMQK